MSLAGKVAVVTGASSGIGAAIAIKFAEEGAKVTIIGRNETRLKKIESTCEKVGVKPLAIIADITNNEDVERIITETIKFFGRIDILVNNAGIVDGAKITDDRAIIVFETIMKTNLHAVVYLTHFAAKHLIESKGNIINISSVAGHKVTDTFSSYAVSKAALDHYTRCMAFELGSKGVRVNSINPGPVVTDMGNSSIHAAVGDFWDKMKSTTILNRNGESEEIADLAAFLASNKARSITGSIIVSDNGAAMLGPWTEFK